jgi:dinuclear metal center YbgI/SA1388 family protein
VAEKIMIKLMELVAYTDDLLKASDFNDYSPNGLQVEGRAEVATVVSGVTASQALVEAAIAAGADALLVHHGYFWKGEDPRVVGMKARRLSALLRSELSLLAYHLPLDAHPLYGNNAQLAQRLGIEIDGEMDTGTRQALALHGHLPEPIAATDFAARIEKSLGREPVHVAGSRRSVRRLAWCTGGGQKFIEQAAALGVDAFISGEISEPTAHVAHEMGLHYFGAGHHATERYGVQALGAHLAQRFGLRHQFIEIPNPA